MGEYAQIVHGAENRVHPNEGNPEVDLADPLAHHAAEHFGEPETHPRKHAENSRHPHDHVEVSYHEVRIVEVEIHRGLAQKDAADAAGDEKGDEPDGVKHRRRETNLRPPQRSDPVESLDRRGHANDHRQYGKDERRIRAHPADEHVMTPDSKSQDSNPAKRINHRAVAEDRLAGEGREDV